MKFRKLMIFVVLLACGAMLYGQPARSASRTLPYGCSGHPDLLPGVMGGPCKPVLGDTQTPQPANDLPSRDDSGTYITFDVPGANGTLAQAINPEGAITGSYGDTNRASHGFLRTPDGAITTFDAPGAGTGPFEGTYPYAINPQGTITGYYCSPNFVVCPGFLRNPDGTFTIFDVPGDVCGTEGFAINPAGAVTGIWWDVNCNYHGFVRAQDGTITTFDVSGNGAWSTAINPAGDIVGAYFDASGSHGFLRTRDGGITTFDVPGGVDTAFFPFFYGQNASINPPGEIASNYFQPIPGNPFGGNHRGMLRHTDGTFETWDAGPMLPCCNWTYSTGITPNGTITGFDNDGHDVFHGFLRTPDGTITTFDAPGAGTGHFQGTVPLAINPGKVITGLNVDSKRMAHGFVRLPH